ncbi:MAG: ROK family protein [Sodaliphilus pleomorphus]|uniref:ROK family protein n=1 Tax=Sodaliphilus pleomorphus TaxID=2606626 RepID=UPI00240909C5|nr:ROK family protein [Sodaliphilus pleomorphus]MDD6475633.1 ROK family protein [Sodaliphilus pleomorphus]MDD6686409.1 ROK family protein [Sodaliphilus pleomorphus]
MAVIALDLGGTKIASAIVDDAGGVKFTHKNMLQGRTGHEVGRLIVDSLSRQFDKAQYHRIPITAIGICVPGSVNCATGHVWAPNIPGWGRYPLAQEVLTLLPEHKVPVYVDNDRSCSVYGELWKGAAQGCRNVIFMAVGTGIGAGIVIDGHTLHGANDIIGATGWMALQSPFIEQYGPQGCFEYYASGTGICNRAKEKVRADKSYRGSLRQLPISRISTKHVFEAYDKGDCIAASVLAKAVEMWGMATANFVSLFNPEKIIWGGGVFGPARVFIPAIYEEALKWAQPLSIKMVELVPTQLPDSAGLLGAGFLALNNGKVQLD